MQRSQFDSVLAALAPESVVAPDRPFSQSSIDSLGVVNILVAIEDAFGVEFDEQSLTTGAALSPDVLFDTVSNLAAA
ncbi:phosphopantetheine-binding protein [Rhodococcoides fascians]|uniref:phosphopantetheine-binding protein n=1 Tax=Rhodococcoides fascians TaxID=1828 RepID=UPI00050CD05D|nr:phosphopantetheine-binding protein [Rhodococcus fascians]